MAVFLFALVLSSAPLRAARQQQAAPGEGQVLHILVNKSVVINTQAPVVRIMTGNPAAIDTVATTPTQIVVTGKSPGTSSLIIWDSPDRSQLLDVTVEPDVTSLRAAIERAYPGQQINVETEGGRIVLSGSVSAQRIADDAAKLAGLFSTQVVNSIVVPAAPPPPRERQVMLEVKFAEVDRNKITQLGINLFSTGATNTIGTITTQQFSPATINSVGGSNIPAVTLSDLLNVFVFRPDLNLGLTIKDLEQRSLLQILAEPNLLALNGQKASFLAGGEFPVPIVQGGANAGAITIQFRQFGVKLDFVGTITDDIVRLHVVPEVSTLDFANAVSVSGFSVPAFSTRRAETEIELRDGQSFGIAGLLDRRAQTQLNKMPGVGDIPIIGRLFTSKSINRGNTELIVLVTPRIVDPVNAPAGAPQLPKYPMPLLDSPAFDKTVPGNNNSASPSSRP